MRILRKLNRSDNFHQKLKITLVFMLVGFMLGYFVKWTQEAGVHLTRSPFQQQQTLVKELEEVKGYLRRDEQRDKRR